MDQSWPAVRQFPAQNFKENLKNDRCHAKCPKSINHLLIYSWDMQKNWKFIGNLLKVDKNDSFCWFTILFWDQFTDTTESNGLVVLFIKCLRQFGCDDLKVCRPAATTYVHTQTLSDQSVSDIFLREPLRNRPDLGNVKTRKALVYLIPSVVYLAFLVESRF